VPPVASPAPFHAASRAHATLFPWYPGTPGTPLLRSPKERYWRKAPFVTLLPGASSRQDTDDRYPEAAFATATLPAGGPKLLFPRAQHHPPTPASIYPLGTPGSPPIPAPKDWRKSLPLGHEGGSCELGRDAVYWGRISRAPFYQAPCSSPSFPQAPEFPPPKGGEPRAKAQGSGQMQGLFPRSPHRSRCSCRGLLFLTCAPIP
jgi:hypothetical protein